MATTLTVSSAKITALMPLSTAPAYATTDSMRHTLYYTQRNMGKFVIAETKAPNGYFGDWTNIDHPGTANTPLGKRGYYIEITEDKDNSVIWLDNADYNADIAVTDMGGTKLVTSAGVETTVTIYDTAKDPRRTYNTDNSGKAANEDNYSSAVNSICQTVSGKFKNPNIEGTIFFGLAFKVQWAKVTVVQSGSLRHSHFCIKQINISHKSIF